MEEARRDQAFYHLTELFSRSPGFFHLWAKNTGTRWWTRENVATAADFVARTNVDIWVGVGLSASRLTQHERLKATDCIALPGLWADIDVTAGEGLDHGKRRFPDREAAMAFLLTLPEEPSLIIDSGGGLQAWWLFDEPLLIGNDAERFEAQRLTQGFTEMIQAKAKLLDCDVDSVHDLARLMRVAGGINTKYGEPRPVTL